MLARRIIRPCREGFTLVELLVVIAISGTLLGLLLPAIQAAREAARRAQCADHLRQMGLGFQRYHDVEKAYPDGGKNGCDSPQGRDPRVVSNCPDPTWCGWVCPIDRSEWSWPYQILPYIEQQSVYDDPVESRVFQTPIKLYYCPSRRAPELFLGLAKGDYAGCAGDNGSNGVLIRRGMQPRKASSILDGLANTIMLGEKQLNPDRFGVDIDDNEPFVAPGWEVEIFRLGSLTYPPGPDRDHPSRLISSGMSYSYRFGSSHPGCFLVVLADGSVRVVSFTIAPEIFHRLCVVDDRETVGGY